MKNPTHILTRNSTFNKIRIEYTVDEEDPNIVNYVGISSVETPFETRGHHKLTLISARADYKGRILANYVPSTRINQ